MAQPGLEALVVVIIGLVGGFANACLSQPLRKPGKVKLPNGEIGYVLGWIGNVFVGGIAAFAFWGLELTNPSSPQVYATALISGIGGARVIDDLLHKRNLKGTVEGLTDVI